MRLSVSESISASCLSRQEHLRHLQRLATCIANTIFSTLTLQVSCIGFPGTQKSCQSKDAPVNLLPVGRERAASAEESATVPSELVQGSEAVDSM